MNTDRHFKIKLNSYNQLLFKQLKTLRDILLKMVKPLVLTIEVIVLVITKNPALDNPIRNRIIRNEYAISTEKKQMTKLFLFFLSIR